MHPDKVVKQTVLFAELRRLRREALDSIDIRRPFQRCGLVPFLPYLGCIARTRSRRRGDRRSRKGSIQGCADGDQGCKKLHDEGNFKNERWYPAGCCVGL